MKTELERVELREPGVNTPHADAGKFGNRERILYNTIAPNKRLTREQHFLLWHDGEYLYIAHPERPTEPEVVPMHMVLQFRPVAVEKKATK